MGRADSLTIQLFKSKLLGLPDEAEDHEPSEEVECCVESDYIWVSDHPVVYSTGPLTCTSWGHDGPHAGKGQAKDAGYKRLVRDISVD